MTKKEKKELALKFKAEIDAKKPKPEKTEIISEEQKKKNNQRRYAATRSSPKDREAMTGKYKVSKHFDKGLDKW